MIIKFNRTLIISFLFYFEIADVPSVSLKLTLMNAINIS
jgi:hypothetical protein